MRQENAQTTSAALDFDFLAENLVAVLLMVPAEKVDQVRNQGETEKHGKADEQDADDFPHAAIRFLLLFGFLRFGCLAFGRFLTLFRAFLFGFLLFYILLSINQLFLQRLSLGQPFRPECVLFAFVSGSHFQSSLMGCKNTQKTRLMAAFWSKKTGHRKGSLLVNCFTSAP